MIDREQILKKIISVVNDNDPDSEIYLYGSPKLVETQRDFLTEIY